MRPAAVLALGAVALLGPTVAATTAASPSVRPLPFALVSRAGTQSATNLHAAVCSKPARQCSFSWSGELPPVGPAPVRLSVVRPGEAVRFVLPTDAPLPTVRGRTAWPRLDLEPFCGDVTSVLVRPVPHGRWTVHLRPGRYTAVVFFLRTSSRGLVGEVGVLGLLVSASKPYALVPAPSCPRGLRGGVPYTYP
jgi:hypothetical protein